MCIGCFAFMGLLVHPSKRKIVFIPLALKLLMVSRGPGEFLGFSRSSVWKLDACQLHRLAWAIPTGLLLKHQICQGCSNLLLGCLQVLVDNVVEFHTFVFGERFLGPFPHFKLVLACNMVKCPWPTLQTGESLLHETCRGLMRGPWLEE